ncbi:uncharacterized protein LOC132258186 isoform X1 [Phlebotomus argentipes]|uniref:uncharacterized protein LOC132258186 isoform X1 n=1 Tax=Phlebotomus argentipes TaxID=94469 RepID=UPI0028929F05|nr:uncharacterized protein LOC132258186 isoform X1 [Phlebotomus argentipes]
MLPRTKVFVGSVPQGTKPEDLRRLFEKFGVVTECDIMNRCGFVHMQSQEMADSAIQALNNTTFRGATITVERGRMKERGAGGAGGAKKGPGGGMMGQRNNMGGMQRGPPMGARGPMGGMGPGGPRGPMGGPMRGPPGPGMNKGGPGGGGVRNNMRGPMGGGGAMGGGQNGPMRRDNNRGNNRPNPYQRDRPDFGMRGKGGGMRNGMEPFPPFDDMLPPMEMARGGMMDRGMMDRGSMGGAGGPDRFNDDGFGFSNEDRRGFALPERQMYDQDGPMFDDRRDGPPFDDMRRGPPPMRGRGGGEFAGAGDFLGRPSGMGGGEMFTRRGPQMRGGGGPRGGGGGFDMGDGYNQAFPPLGGGGGMNRNGPPRRW